MNIIFPKTNKENENFITYTNKIGEVVSIRKDDISFIRLIANRKSEEGYVTIIGLVNNAKDQHEFFDCYESAEEFAEMMLKNIE